MLLIVYGMAGAGKTYLGKLLQKKFGFYFWDADNALTDNMIDCIKQKKLIDQSVRNEYVDVIKERISLLLNTVHDQPIVVSQALYKSPARKMLMQSFKEAYFIHVDAQDEIILKRLKKRNNNMDSDYLMGMKVHFDQPDHEEMQRTLTIDNSLDKKKGLLHLLKTHFSLTEVMPSPKAIHTTPVYLTLDTSIEDDLQHRLKALCKEIPFFTIQDPLSDVLLDSTHALKVHIEKKSTPNHHDANHAWLDTHLRLQNSDIKIAIQPCNHAALLYGRDNTIKQIVLDSTDALLQYLLAYVKKNAYKIQTRSSSALPFRDRIEHVNHYYQKYFSWDPAYLSGNSLHSTLHLIKTLDGNKNCLQVNTFISAKLYKQPHSLHCPTMIFFPGTAFTRMLGKTVEQESYKLAAQTGCNVFTIHYRLSPENPYPAALHDALLAYEYLVKNADSLALNPAQIICAGYSSGATLALQLYSLSLKHPSVKPSSAILISPILDFSDTPLELHKA